MRNILLVCAVGAGILASHGAEAAGCLKGALVGGVVGHYAGHHGLLGAAAGCVYGRHQANQERREHQQAPPDQTR